MPCPSHPPLYDDANKISWSVQVMKHVIGPVLISPSWPTCIALIHPSREPLVPRDGSWQTIPLMYEYFVYEFVPEETVEQFQL
jgi:hypothetical protein